MVVTSKATASMTLTHSARTVTTRTLILFIYSHTILFYLPMISMVYTIHVYPVLLPLVLHVADSFNSREREVERQRSTITIIGVGTASLLDAALIFCLSRRFLTAMSEEHVPIGPVPPSGQECRCAICLEDIDPEVQQQTPSEYYRSRCGHITHSRCLQASVRSGNYNCPLCRQPLGDISVELGAVEKRLHRFVKMLKSGLAPAAVRQRMVVDGIPPAMIDAFFTGGASRAMGDGEENEVQTPGEREEHVQALYEKYRKMLDRGIPEGAVRQKMQAAQGELTKDEIDRFFATSA